MGKARINIEDREDGTINIMVVYEGGGPNKASHAHVAAYRTMQWLDSQLKQLGPLENVQAKFEGEGLQVQGNPDENAAHRLLIMPLSNNHVGGACQCGEPIIMPRSGDYEDKDISMRDVQEIIRRFLVHAPDGQYLIGPFYKEDMDRLLNGGDLGGEESVIVGASGEPLRDA